MTDIIERICKTHNISLTGTKRFTVGQGNYVFQLNTVKESFVIRLGHDSYEESINLLNLVSSTGVTVPKPMFSGECGGFNYMICSYINGKDIGLIYNELTDSEKKTIAKEVVEIQSKVSKISLPYQCDMVGWVHHMLDRARYRIKANGFFDTSKVDEVEKLVPLFEDYFKNLQLVVYLDDISTKNLMINNGHVAGVVDIDWLGYGDPLTFVTLTNIALLDMQYDTDYVDFLLNEMGACVIGRKVFILYSLLYCVDFMGERGSTFNDKTIEVNESVINKLNCIYDHLYNLIS